MSTIFRWFLAVAAPIFGWYLALGTGLALLSFAESYCPSSQMVSGMCMASWFPMAERGVFCFSAALAAFLMVTGSTVSAPFWRSQVAWIVYGLGTALALAMAFATSAWAEFASAVTAGGVTSFVLARRYEPRAADFRSLSSWR